MYIPHSIKAYGEIFKKRSLYIKFDEQHFDEITVSYVHRRRNKRKIQQVKIMNYWLLIKFSKFIASNFMLYNDQSSQILSNEICIKTL